VVSTRFLPTGVVEVLKRSPRIYRVARATRFAVGRALGARELPGVPGRVHYNDFMLDSDAPKDVAHYRRCAEEWIGTLEAALRRCGLDWKDLKAVLEIGCGYGRIVRFLVQRVSPDHVYVCDVIDEAATFTAQEFAVHKVSPVGGSDFPGSESLDLVYLLSVFTHLRAFEIVRMLNAIDRAMRPGGTLVFTIHGWASVDGYLASYPPPWPERRRRISAALEATGQFYEGYPHYREDIGMAWHTQDFIRSLVADAAPSFAFVHFGSGEHDGHQDVMVYQKR
jgi:SAM-dependent methyltransferase